MPLSLFLSLSHSNSPLSFFLFPSIALTPLPPPLTLVLVAGSLEMDVQFVQGLLEVVADFVFGTTQQNVVAPT